jgi:hypothetical protein
MKNTQRNLLKLKCVQTFGRFCYNCLQAFPCVYYFCQFRWERQRSCFLTRTAIETKIKNIRSSH